MIDEKKLERHPRKAMLFRNVSPPREVLTQKGLIVWRTRWVALAIGSIAVIAAHFLWQ
jgi:hypothetical protein